MSLFLNEQGLVLILIAFDVPDTLQSRIRGGDLDFTVGVLLVDLDVGPEELLKASHLHESNGTCHANSG